jgi:chromosomal replication initiator protein
MEGALVKLLALASLKKEDITIDLTREVIKDLVGKAAFSQLSLKYITTTVTHACNVPLKPVLGQSRKMELVNARHMAMFLCREMTSSSLINIGKYFGGRDHSTVIHACKTIEDKIEKDIAFEKQLTEIKEQLI